MTGPVTIWWQGRQLVAVQLTDSNARRVAGWVRGRLVFTVGDRSPRVLIGVGERRRVARVGDWVTVDSRSGRVRVASSAQRRVLNNLGRVLAEV